MSRCLVWISLSVEPQDILNTVWRAVTPPPSSPPLPAIRVSSYTCNMNTIWHVLWKLLKKPILRTIDKSHNFCRLRVYGEVIVNHVSNNSSFSMFSKVMRVKRFKLLRSAVKSSKSVITCRDHLINQDYFEPGPCTGQDTLWCHMWKSCQVKMQPPPPHTKHDQVIIKDQTV